MALSLGVQSFPELYTFLIGWNLYDQLWELLSQTGIAFAPFIGIILRNMLLPYTSQEAKDAASTSLRRMEVQLIGTLLLIFLAVSPVMPLNPTLLSYTPLCQTDGTNNAYHPGDTGTTWDSAFAIPNQEIRVPIWWYAVMALSSGFTSSADTMVACAPNLRKMVTEVDMAQITDPALKQQLQQFELQCYLPARTQYLQDAQNNASTLPSIQNARQQYGEDDTEWLGSHGFQTSYYPNLHAQQPVPGFAYQASADMNADSQPQNPPAYGTPDCNTWWNDSENGLKTRLYHTLPKAFNEEFASFFNNDTADHYKDSVLRKIIRNGDAPDATTGYDKANTTVGEWGYSNLAEAVGSWFSQLTNYPKLYAAEEAAPIIQALLLLLVFTFLPFALVFSGYQPKAFLTGAGIIFSLIFWSFIWRLVTYTDTTLMNALYSSNWFAQQSASATLADMMTASLIIIAPLFWFSFMGVMGVAIGDVVSRAFNSMKDVGEQAAQEGAQTVQSAAKEIASTAAKKLL